MSRRLGLIMNRLPSFPPMLLKPAPGDLSIAHILAESNAQWAHLDDPGCGKRLTELFEELDVIRRTAREGVDLTATSEEVGRSPARVTWEQASIVQVEVGFMLALRAWRDWEPDSVVHIVPAIVDMLEPSLEDPWSEFTVYTGPPSLQRMTRCCMWFILLVAEALRPGTRTAVAPFPELGSIDRLFFLLLSEPERSDDPRMKCMYVINDIVTGRLSQLGAIVDLHERAVASAARGMLRERQLFGSAFGTGVLSNVAMQRAIDHVPPGMHARLADRMDVIARSINTVPEFPEALTDAARRVRSAGGL